MALAIKPIYAKISFVVARYFPDKNGVLRPRHPAKCIAPENGQHCYIVIEGWRKRIRGPGFPLAVFRCKSHDVCFTVYPPGWVPYGRRALVSLSATGQRILEEEPQQAWALSEFKAVFDAASADIWPPETSLAEEPPPGCKRTQQRHIRGFLKLFGLDDTKNAKQRELTAEVLNLDLSLLEGEWHQYRARDGPLMQTRGKLGMKVLEVLIPQEALFNQLLLLGVGLFWGPPLPP